MASNTFYEILARQIRDDLRPEMELAIAREVERKLQEKLGDSSRSRPNAYVRTTNFNVQHSHPTNSFEHENIETWLLTRVKKVAFSKIQNRQHTDLKRSRSQSCQQNSKENSKQSIKKNSEHLLEPRQLVANHELSNKDELRCKAESSEDLLRIELLRRNGGPLNEYFSIRELKAAWRQAALKTHPDRFSQAETTTQDEMSEVFREICDAYAALLQHFSAHEHHTQY